MNVSDLTIGHIGKTIRVTGDGTTATGLLTDMSASADIILDPPWHDPDRKVMGRLRKVDLTVGAARVRISAAATVEVIE